MSNYSYTTLKAFKGYALVNAQGKEIYSRIPRKLKKKLKTESLQINRTIEHIFK